MTTTNDASAPAAGRAAHRVIRPRRGLSILEFRELLDNRELVYRFSRRDLTLRYRQTALGVVWVVLQPLIAALVFTFVFGKVAHLHSDGVSYLVFAFAGMITWNAFSNTVTRASVSVVGNSNIITKVFFPRVLLPVSVTTASLVDALVALVVMVVLLFAYGVGLSWRFVTFPLWLLVTLVLAQSIGMASAALTVRFRDVQYVLPVLIQFGLYASPVAYSVSAVPKSFRIIDTLNPLTGVLEGTRWSLLGRGNLDLGMTVYSIVASVVTIVLAALIFERFERHFSDVI